MSGCNTSTDHSREFVSSPISVINLDRLVRVKDLICDYGAVNSAGRQLEGQQASKLRKPFKPVWDYTYFKPFFFTVKKGFKYKGISASCAQCISHCSPTQSLTAFSWFIILSFCFHFINVFSFNGGLFCFWYNAVSAILYDFWFDFVGIHDTIEVLIMFLLVFYYEFSSVYFSIICLFGFLPFFISSSVYSDVFFLRNGIKANLIPLIATTNPIGENASI